MNCVTSLQWSAGLESCMRKCHVVVSSDPGSCHLVSTLLQPALAMVCPHQSYSASKTWPSTTLRPIGFLLTHSEGGSATAQQNDRWFFLPAQQWCIKLFTRNRTAGTLHVLSPTENSFVQSSSHKKMKEKKLLLLLNVALEAFQHMWSGWRACMVLVASGFYKLLWIKASFE